MAKAEDLKSQGINEVICVSVNDPFVMAAWAKDQGTGGKVRLLADPSAALAKALDLTVDIAPLGGVSMLNLLMNICHRFIEFRFAVNDTPWWWTMAKLRHCKLNLMAQDCLVL